MKKFIIFDLDGTLLNTVEDLATATNHALDSCGYPLHPVNDYYRFVGNGVRKLFERALPPEARTADEVERIRSLFLPYYGEHCTDYTHPYDGMCEVLDQLQSEGISFAVASNKYKQATQKLIAHFFAHNSFVAVMGQCEGVPLKPDATIVHNILSLTGFKADDTLYVGDSGIDIETARNAGLRVAAVTWGFRPREELTALSPDYLIDTPCQLLDIH